MGIKLIRWELVFSVKDRIEKQDWIDHLSRMEERTIPKMAFKYKPVGKRATT